MSNLCGTAIMPANMTVLAAKKIADGIGAKLKPTRKGLMLEFDTGEQIKILIRGK